MKRIFLLFAFAIAITSYAQPQEGSAQETARSFMRVGDWDNAILVLNSAIAQDPENVDYKKDLALAYTYKRDFARALEVVEPLLDRNDVDVQTFQIGGNIYRALAEVKDADKMYKKGLKKFPKSGPLYSEYGELLLNNRENIRAIEMWEKGIEADPSYAGNYYNAATYYFDNNNKIWTLLYGEIFVNMEYLTERATEMKQILLSTYKEKLFNSATERSSKGQPAFEKSVQDVFNKQGSLVVRGMDIETLIMLRTRFILEWSDKYAAKFPYKLFDYHQQLIREGMFEAYNQWLFGPVSNLGNFDQWTRSNAAAYAKFSNFQKGRVFKMPAGQHYND